MVVRGGTRLLGAHMIGHIPMHSFLMKMKVQSMFLIVTYQELLKLHIHQVRSYGIWVFLQDLGLEMIIFVQI